MWASTANIRDNSVHVLRVASDDVWSREASLFDVMYRDPGSPSTWLSTADQCQSVKLIRQLCIQQHESSGFYDCGL